jgi:ATP-dependent Clp protease adaptor protein ClpS
MEARPDLTSEASNALNHPWTVLVGNDPVNTMEFVTYALAKVFDLATTHAETLMLHAHEHGRTAVWSGEKLQAEAYASELHQWGLWATIVEGR